MQRSTGPAPSLSVFFPAYNDSGTIASMVIRAVKAAAELTPDFEVIVVNDGSADGTAEIADELARTYPQVRVVHHPINRGYGAALQTGFRSATKELIFYTDGDAQYDPAELALLWAQMTPDIDLVNGYKISRADPLHRIVIGRVYHHIVSLLFGLKLRDVDCDFRLMRRTIFERINLEKTSGVICVEMMKKIQDAGFRIVEVPVHHYHRAFGKSQFFNFRRLLRTGRDLLRLWFALVIRREHHAPARRRWRAARPIRRTARTPARRARERGLPRLLPRPPRHDHRRPRVHRQQPRAPPRRARRRRAARRLADSRLRRQPVQHRRHRRPVARQRRRRPPAEHHELPGARPRGDLQPRRPGQPHRQHARSRTRISRSTAAAS